MKKKSLLDTEKSICISDGGMPGMDEIDEIDAAQSASFAAPAADGFIVYLRLRADNFRLMKARRLPDGPFIPMPQVVKNCFSDCTTCFNNGNYQPILAVSCTDNAFDFELHFQNTQDSNVWGKATIAVTPDCQYTGQVECIG